MILVFHARLPTLWVVIMRHVEPAEGKKKNENGEERRGEVRDEERDIWNTHKVIISYLVIARRINVTRFTFSHF